MIRYLIIFLAAAVIFGLFRLFEKRREKPTIDRRIIGEAELSHCESDEEPFYTFLLYSDKTLEVYKSFHSSQDMEVKILTDSESSNLKRLFDALFAVGVTAKEGLWRLNASDSEKGITRIADIGVGVGKSLADNLCLLSPISVEDKNGCPII